MASKIRIPMQVSPAFEIRIKNLQKQIMKKDGKVVSLRDLTEKIAKATNFDDLEKSILSVSNQDLTINFDRRKRKC